jgi:hypothetical protein
LPLPFLLIPILLALICIAAATWAALLARLLGGFIHARRLSEKSAESNNYTGKVTAIIPMRNEFGYVTLLSSLFERLQFSELL